MLHAIVSGAHEYSHQISFPGVIRAQSERRCTVRSCTFQDNIDPISYWREIMDKVRKPAAQAERKKLNLHLPMGFPGPNSRKNTAMMDRVQAFKKTYPTKVVITRVRLCACVSCLLPAIAVHLRSTRVGLAGAACVCPSWQAGRALLTVTHVASCN